MKKPPENRKFITKSQKEPLLSQKIQLTQKKLPNSERKKNVKFIIPRRKP